MKYWKLEPEVAAELGEKSSLDTSLHPPRVERLHLRFTGWLGDDLVECFPCFVATEKLCDALESANLTGYRVEELEMSVGDEMSELHPEVELPRFKWLALQEGGPQGDLSTDEGHNLLVSERAMNVLKQFRLDQCDVEMVESTRTTTADR